MKRGSLRISCLILSSDSADTSISPVSCCLPEGPECSVIALTLNCAERTVSSKQGTAHHCPWRLCSPASATAHGWMLQVPHLNETLEARQGPALLSRGSSCVAWLSELQAVWDALFSWALRVRPSENSRFRRWLAAATLPHMSRSHGIVSSPQGQSYSNTRISARQVCSAQQEQAPAAALWTCDTSSCCADKRAALRMQCRTACSSPCTTLPLIPGGWIASGTHCQQPLQGHRCRFIPAALPGRKRCTCQTIGRPFVTGKPHQACRDTYIVLCIA